MSDELLDQLVEALVKGLVIIVPILFAILTRYLVKVLNAKAAELDALIQASNNELLIDAAGLVVLAAEQMVQLNTGEKRMAYAKVQLQSLASGFGVELSDRDAIALIEGTLGAINQELPAILQPPVAVEGQVTEFEIEVPSNDAGAGV